MTVEPPTLPDQPLYPNRLEFGAAGGGGGVGVALLLALFYRSRQPLSPRSLTTE